MHLSTNMLCYHKLQLSVTVYIFTNEAYCDQCMLWNVSRALKGYVNLPHVMSFIK